VYKRDRSRGPGTKKFTLGKKSLSRNRRKDQKKEPQREGEKKKTEMAREGTEPHGKSKLLL